MNDRERFLATILGQPVDRPPYWLFWSPWWRTWQRWESEGKPPEITDHRSFFKADSPPRPIPVNFGPCPRRERVVLDEDAESVTFLDSWGIRRKDLKANESMSAFLEFPVKNRKNWEEYRDRWLDPEHPERLVGNWREVGSEWMREGAPIQLGSFPDVGLFGTLRWLLGDEECLVAFITMPDLVHEIMGHMTDLYLTVFSQVVKEIRVDVIHLWEDMCGCQGPLISPRHWREFMGPQYRRIRAFAERHQIPILSVDTDGNPDLIAQPMIEAGVNYLYPMEVAAGCDVNEWREKYPELALMGGIDKRVLAVGPREIDAELERIRPAMKAGRYIPDLDHLVPSDVSWENYRYYAERLRNLVKS